MKNNPPLIVISIITTVLFLVNFFVVPTAKDVKSEILTTETASVKQVSNTILASGTVESENEADLHFQTGGKLVWLPVKEGDKVQAGQVIAQLDTYALQRQLTQAFNTYKSAQDTADQVKDNINNGIVEGQQRTTLDSTNKNSYSNAPEAQVIYDAIKRIADQNQNTLNNANINVELANYAISLSTLTAPFDGVITHADVSSAGVNITPTTIFSIADPSKTIFKANVSETDINFITTGVNATITLNGSDKQLHGTVTKIYPQKVTLPSGENVYKVEIQSDELVSNSVLKQAGSVLINNKYDEPVMLVPAWTVLNRAYVWVMNGNVPQLKKVTIGNTVGNDIEIKSGLTNSDKVIISPKTVIKKLYPVL